LSGRNLEQIKVITLVVNKSHEKRHYLDQSMTTMLHRLAIASDEVALASNCTLPNFVRMKSQSLGQYLTVLQDGKGTLTFRKVIDHTDPTVVFETIHVQVLRNSKSEGRKGVKVKSLATNKYWKRITKYKVPHGKVSQDQKAKLKASLYNVVMAVADVEKDGDIFDFETEQVTKVGAHSKKVNLWNPIDMRYLAPFSTFQSNFSQNALHFLGYMSREKRFETMLSCNKN
jgi:hypothetical protein